MLAKSKRNTIKTLVPQALSDIEKSNEEFITIMKEKKIPKGERKCEECQ